MSILSYKARRHSDITAKLICDTVTSLAMRRKRLAAGPAPVAGLAAHPTNIAHRWLAGGGQAGVTGLYGLQQPSPHPPEASLTTRGNRVACKQQPSRVAANEGAASVQLTAGLAADGQHSLTQLQPFPHTYLPHTFPLYFMPSLP